MKPYLCLYQYRGMETEGHTQFEEHFKCFASDEVEAIYMYLVWLAVRKNEEPYHKTLSDHRNSSFPDGGWGFFVYRLKKLDESQRSDTEWFLNKYKKYNK